jgi:ParB/RepB/Spo0J family partition protein
MNNIQFVLVPLEKIVHNRYQQAGVKDEAAVMEIVSSLMQHRDNGTKGLLQVPTARALEDGTYELAFGHHRFYAFDYLAVVEGMEFFTSMPLNVQDLTDLQMFELLGIENLQRRGIGPVEEANIFNTYMTNFHKTSVEAAKKFGKTEEYIRGSIRLLRLPESVLTKMADGSLNKTQARDLLVAERLGGADLVQEIVEELAGGEEEGLDVDDKDTVQDIMRTSKKIQYLDIRTNWNSAKKFPVKHLAPLTAKNIYDLLDFDMTGHDVLIDDVIKDLMVLISSGMEITDNAFPMIAPESLAHLRVMINPPQCEKCQFHAVLDGSHFCGMPLCMKRKYEAWKLHEQDEYAKIVGIPLYQKSDGPMVELQWRDKDDEKLYKSGSADLRLVPAQYVWNNFEGISQNFKVVLVGKGVRARLDKQSSASQKVEKERAKEQKEREFIEIKREFLARFEWEVVSLAFESMLDGFNSYSFMYFFRAECMDWFADDTVWPEDVNEDELIKGAETAKKSDGLKTMRRVNIFHIVEQAHNRICDFSMVLKAKKPLAVYAKDFQSIAAQWNVTLPKDFVQQSEKYQAELDAAIKAL